MITLSIPNKKIGRSRFDLDRFHCIYLCNNRSTVIQLTCAVIKPTIQRIAPLLMLITFMILVYTGFQFIQGLVYTGFQFIQGLVYTGFQFIQGLVYTGFQFIQALVYTGFQFIQGLELRWRGDNKNIDLISNLTYCHHR
jgi:hypothetical protein